MFDTPLKVFASIFISIFALMPVAIILLISLSQIISIGIIALIPVSIFYLIFRRKKTPISESLRNQRISALYRKKDNVKLDFKKLYDNVN